MRPTVVFNNGAHLADMLTSYKGASQFTLETVTVPHRTVKARGVMVAKNTPFNVLFKGDVYKTAKRFATIGVSYENAVNGRLAKEEQPEAGEFQAKPLPYGVWRDGSKVVLDHNGKPMIRVTYLNANKDYGTSVYHYANGEVLTENEVAVLKADFFDLPSKNTRQGTDEPVVVNSIYADNIRRMAVDGVDYVHRSLLVGK